MAMLKSDFNQLIGNIPYSKYQKLLANAFRYVYNEHGTIRNLYATPLFIKVSCEFYDPISIYSVIGTGIEKERPSGDLTCNIFKAILELSDEHCIQIMNEYGLFNMHHDTSITFDYNNWQS